MPDTLPPPPDLDDDLLDDDDPIIQPRKNRDTGEMDFTSMIDVVFLLLIFFLVTSQMDEDKEVEQPKARHGQGVSVDSSVIITIAANEGKGPPKVYLGDGCVGAPLPDDREQMEAAVKKAVDTGFNQEAKTYVIIKADRRIEVGDFARVAGAVGKSGVDPSKIQKVFAAVKEED